jgi:hypothetical protein
VSGNKERKNECIEQRRKLKLIHGKERGRWMDGETHRSKHIDKEQ